MKKLTSGLFKIIIYKMCLEIIYLIFMYKKDLALNNLQWLICHKIKANQMSQGIFLEFNPISRMLSTGTVKFTWWQVLFSC